MVWSLWFLVKWFCGTFQHLHKWVKGQSGYSNNFGTKKAIILAILTLIININIIIMLWAVWTLWLFIKWLFGTTKQIWPLTSWLYSFCFSSAPKSIVTKIGNIPHGSTNMEYTSLTNNHNLETLYTHCVMVEKTEQAKYLELLLDCMNFMIEEMKQGSPEFEYLFKEIYHGGSVFDGLKVKSTDQEFDLNLVFNWKTKDLTVTGLGSDTNMKNFCFLRTNKPLNALERCIVDYSSDGQCYVSPEKMFALIQRSVDRALSNINGTLEYQGRRYRVTRQVNAPITLKLVGLDDDTKFEVDLVPSIKLDYSALRPYQDVSRHTKQICNSLGVNPPSCMAISLPKANSSMFEIDFHEVERSILYHKGCAKKVIKLMKFLRDFKGGSVVKLWSHLLKVALKKLHIHLIDMSARKPHARWKTHTHTHTHTRIDKHIHTHTNTNTHTHAKISCLMTILSYIRPL